MTSEESKIVKALKKQNFKLDKWIDYDKDHWIVKVTRPDGNDTDPYYAVDKRTLALSLFPPILDLSILDRFDA